MWVCVGGGRGLAKIKVRSKNEKNYEYGHIYRVFQSEWDNVFIYFSAYKAPQ